MFRRWKLSALRGGDYDCHGSGVFALQFNLRRTSRGVDLGFRPALASSSSEALRLRLPGRNER